MIFLFGFLIGDFYGPTKDTNYCNTKLKTLLMLYSVKCCQSQNDKMLEHY